ncbi:MAG: M48 family metallopeptidase [Thermoanaerobacterales bacterium]|nr:M48 family metallopeptidase [Thermoanaerobacterales bacterium]
MPNLVHPREPLYLALLLICAIAFYVILIVSLVGIAYVLLGVLAALVIHGLFIGHLRGNGVRVGETQFPEVHRVARELAAQMGVSTVPDIYILQAGGLLNAFATRFGRRNFIVLYSDVLELLEEKGEAELAFVLAHEMTHLRRRHTTWQTLLYPAMLVPFLGSAYSRACEYTCDRYAAYYVPQGAPGGLLVLAAGRRLFRRVDPERFAAQAREAGGFWYWFAEVLSSHPHLSRRVAAVSEFARGSVGAGIPVSPPPAETGSIGF